MSIKNILHSKLSKLTLLAILVFCFQTTQAQLWLKRTNPYVGYLNEVSNSDTTILNKQINKNANYWTTFNLDHKFFILDTLEFRKNQVTTLNTNYRKYKDYVMSLKFYPPSDLNIKYQPTLVNSTLLYDERGHLDIITAGSNSNNLLGKVFNMTERNESLFIYNPALVKHVLKTIPEPHRLITDRKHLEKRSAEDGLSRLLNSKIDSPNKLDKTIKKKGPWTYGGIENIQLSQAHLVNWTKGGENSAALQSDLLVKANYKKDNVEWENYARHKVGILSSESYPVQVNTDNIIANSKYGLKASKKWYYSFLFDFNSQLFNGYNNKKRETIISGFMSPAYFTFALGMDFKKSADFTLLLSPLTSKITYVKDTAKVDQERYKIDADRKSAFDTGASLTNNFNWKISTELNLRYKLDVFVGYFDKDPAKQVDWELIFDMRINQYFSTRLNTQLRYYSNESDKIQFKEYFAINFNYKF